MSESTLDIARLDKGLKWGTFLKAYQEEFGLTYAQAMMSAGPAWVEYKELHGILTKHQLQQQQQRARKEPPIVAKRKAAGVTPKGKVKQNIKVKTPPKGKKAVVTYVTDSESEEEVKPKAKSKPKAEAPAVKPPPEEKASGIVKKKKTKVVEVEDSEEE